MYKGMLYGLWKEQKMWIKFVQASRAEGWRGYEPLYCAEIFVLKSWGLQTAHGFEFGMSNRGLLDLLICMPCHKQITKCSCAEAFSSAVFHVGKVIFCLLTVDKSTNYLGKHLVPVLTHVRDLASTCWYATSTALYRSLPIGTIWPYFFDTLKKQSVKSFTTKFV